jgi:phytoene dehydrogenase-like protein
MKEQFFKFFSERDWRANERFIEEIGQIRDDLAPSWLEEPLSIEETAARYIRPELRKVFVNLVTRPAEEYLARFEFESELLVAMYAVTDAFSGLNASFGTKGTGMNFLVHNMCRLPGSDGTFMIVEGGMGRITQEFARLAREAGAEILTDTGVAKIRVSQGAARGVTLKDGRELDADTVICNCDPFKMRKLAGESAFGQAFNDKLDKMVRHGTTMKVNLALDRLPTFTCMPENRGQHAATIHLLPQLPGDKGVINHIRKGYEAVSRGELADFPTIEWYIHTPADPTLKDRNGHHNSAFFVQWVPYELKGTTWEKEETRYVNHLVDIAERFAPGFKDSIVDTYTLTPKKVESEFGITYGHIHHVDNTFAMDQRVPYKTPVQGLYSCSAGTHPAGSVVGAAGHNAAKRVMKDMGVSSA